MHRFSSRVLLISLGSRCMHHCLPSMIAMPVTGQDRCRAAGPAHMRHVKVEVVVVSTASKHFLYPSNTQLTWSLL